MKERSVNNLSLLKEEPFLINISQISSVKTAKIFAMCRLIKSYEKSFGKPEQVKKHNIKEVDRNATGNKKIVLKPWKEELLKVLIAEKRHSLRFLGLSPLRH